MPKPYPEEFREDVVRVARNRPDGVTLEQVAGDYGLFAAKLGAGEGTLATRRVWMIG